MDRERLQRAALRWGGLALVAQLWVALVFVHSVIEVWRSTRPELVSFAESANRFSQLKTPALKYPAAGVYFVLFVTALAALLVWLTVRGLREAMAAEPNPPDDER
jgi:hypothetical protein